MYIYFFNIFFSLKEDSFFSAAALLSLFLPDPTAFLPQQK